jgi:hypothetical protein
MNESSRLRRMALGVLAFVALALAGTGVFRFTVQSKLNQAFTRLQSDGYPTNLDELDAFYARIPDDENGYVVLMSAPGLVDDAVEDYAMEDIPDIDNMTEEEHKAWLEKIEQESAETDRYLEEMRETMAAEEALAKEYGGFDNIPIEKLIELHGEPEDTGEEDSDCITREIELTAGPLPADFQQELRAFFDEHAESLNRIVAASEKQNWRSPIDFTKWPDSVDTAHQVAARDACQWLARKAVLDASDGNPDAAVESLLAALRIAKAASSEPTIFAQLVAGSCVLNTIDGIEQIVNRADFAPDHLAELDAALMAAVDPQPIITGLAGECALSRLGFRAEKQEDSILWTDSYTFWNNIPFRYVYNGAGLGKADHLHFLSTVRSLMDCVRTPNAANFQAMTAIVDATENPGLFDLDASNSISSMTMGTGGFYNLVARTQACRAGLALLRFRIDSGNPPEQWDALVPAYLPDIPADPRTDAPFTIERNGEGFAIERGEAALPKHLAMFPISFRVLR